MRLRDFQKTAATAAVGQVKGTCMGTVCRLAVACLGCICFAAMWSGPAWAKLVHPYISSFGLSSGSFASVQGLAVESKSGTVYVYDGGASSVYKFDASGKPVNFSATATNAISVGFAGGAEGEIAVDSSSSPAKGDIYVAHADGSIEIFSEAGAKLGELTEESGDPWGEACGVAVDTSGAVYVGLYYSHVNKYAPSANPVKNTDYVSTLEGVSGVCDVAADSAGNAYVDTWNNGPVTRFEPSQFGSPSPSGLVVDEAGSTLAIDPTQDEVYVDEGGQIAQYGPHGEPFKVRFASSGPGAIQGSVGIAVSGFNGDTYVSDGNGAVSIFGPLSFVEAVPAIEEEYARDVAGTSATLGAAVNPEGSPTAYHFEYGTSASYGSDTLDESVGSGSTNVSLHVHLQGLSPSTLYHYRLVASSAAGSSYGPDQTFSTQRVGGGLSLLDGRQWQLVTPPNKHGANLLPIFEGVVQAADNGRAITYVTIAPTELEPEGNGIREQVLSSRYSGNWSSEVIATPHNEATGAVPGPGFEFRFFTPDLSQAVVEPQGPFTPLSADATEQTVYVRRNVECQVKIATCYTPLMTAANLPEGTKLTGIAGGSGAFSGATSDLSHVAIHSSTVGLTSVPGDEGGLYDWSGGVLQLVSVLPEDEGGTPVRGRLGYEFIGEDARNAISSDGSRVFWTSTSNGGLYVRDMRKHETLRIGNGVDRFEAASKDGTSVFFVANNSALEVCEITETASKLACQTTQLAPSIDGGVPGASDDGSYVYFVSDEALAPGVAAGTCGAGSEPTKSCNLYVAHREAGVWNTPQLIGALSAADSPDWASGAGSLGAQTDRVTGNGQWFAFMSQRPLTAYDTHDAVTGQPDEEVYVYDAANSKLICASCSPTGGRPTGMPYRGGYFGGFLGGGDRIWSNDAMLAANVPGWTKYSLTSALYQSRYLSEQGRLFFNSRDALVPQDVNGTWDVYEYEPAGVGSCTSAAETYSASADGCVDLISSGGSPDESAFMDASETGDDVFFLTSARLASRDFDTSTDIYDAQVCSTAVPCATAVVSPPPCSTGDSCKDAPTPQPSVFGAPASSTFAGAGNVSSGSEAVKRRSISRAQRLKRALLACHRRKPRHKRVVCERAARKRYKANKTATGSR